MKKLFTLLALMVATVAAYGYADVVTPGYQPGGNSFVQTASIDWSTQKLVASIDVTGCTAVNENILSVGTSINVWSKGSHFHLYYTRNQGTDASNKTVAAKTLQVTYFDNDTTKVNKVATVDGDVLVVEISKDGGITINGTSWNYKSDNGSNATALESWSSFNLWTLDEISVGSQEGSTRSNATYNYVRVQGLTETIVSPSITVSDDPAGTNVVDDNTSGGGTAFSNTATINWTTQELVASIDVSKCTDHEANENILSVGASINAWLGDHIHIYYSPKTFSYKTGNNNTVNVTAKTLEIAYLNSSGNYVMHKSATVNADVLVIKFSKSTGITVNGEDWNYSGDTQITDYTTTYSTLWSQSTPSVGSQEGNYRSTATYNYIRVVDLNPTAVTLAESSDNSSTISDNAGKKVASLVLTRTLVADEWNTFCVPFDVPASAMSGFGDMVIKKFQKVDGSKMYLQDAESIEAGQPYLIKPVANITNPTFLNATISSTEAQSVGDGDYHFVGIYSPKEFTNGDTSAYILVSGGKLVNPSGGTMKGIRAYFTYTSSDPEAVAPRLVIDGVETAIAEVLGKEAVSDGRIYNLRGMYVGNDSSRLAKGVYIMNGKKVVLK